MVARRRPPNPRVVHVFDSTLPLEERVARLEVALTDVLSRFDSDKTLEETIQEFQERNREQYERNREQILRDFEDRFTLLQTTVPPGTVPVTPTPGDTAWARFVIWWKKHW